MAMVSLRQSVVCVPSFEASVRRVACGAGAVVAALAVLSLGVAATASAATESYFQVATFGNTGPGQLSEPTKVAVSEATNALLDPAAGDVYVLDQGGNSVERFSASGSYLGQFNGSGTYEVEGKTETGTPAPTGPFGANDIAVNNDESSPSFGDVYVTDGHAVDEFSPVGAYIQQFTGFQSTSLAWTVVGVAVDPSGHLWIFHNGSFPAEEEAIEECNESGSCVSRLDPQDGYWTTGVGLAVDGTGDFYTILEHGYINAQEQNVTEAVKSTIAHPRTTAEHGFGRNVSALAMNSVTNDVVVDEGTQIALYGPGGEPSAPLETMPGDGEAPLSQSAGVAVDGSSSFRTIYATERGANDVAVFRDGLAPRPVTEAATEADETTATLHGSVDPEGEALLAGEEGCRFEYGVQLPYEKTTPCETESGQPIGGGEAPVAVHADLSGLKPLTTYHFRLHVADLTDPAGRDGADATLFTHTAPQIADATSLNVGSVYAEAQAQIDAEGLSTSYHVEYGTSLAYGSSSPAVSIGAATSPVSVLVPLSELQPNTEYHLRFVASNALGATQSADMTFTTYAVGTFTGLPDERGYELVSASPAGQDVDVYVQGPLLNITNNEEHGIWTSRPFDVALDGEGVVYTGDAPSTGGTGETGGGGFGNVYLARRSPGGGWTQTDLNDEAAGVGQYTDFSSELSVGVSVNGSPPGTGAPQGYPNLYAHSTTAGVGGEYQPFFTATPDRAAIGEILPNGTGFAGANAGTTTVPAFSRLLFELNAGALEGEGSLGEELNEDVKQEVAAGTHSAFVHYLYVSAGGRAHLVDVLPDGKVAPGATFGSLEENDSNGYTKPGFTNVIAADGSRVFWTAAPDVKENGGELSNRSQGLYVRENPTQPQSPVEGEECTVPADACTVQVSGPGSIYRTASADGSKVFFTSGREELYEYDLETNETIELAAGTRVKGVVGTSEDGEYVYYAESNGNIMLWHEGVTVEVAAAAANTGVFPFSGGLGGGGYHSDYLTELGSRTAEVTPDGHSLIFMSTASLTGYDNMLEGARLSEVYRYETQAGKLTCVSCNPTGEPPVPTEMSAARTKSEASVGSFISISGSPTYQPLAISDDGSRVVFNSAEPLVPEDTNGFIDVYEWERDGTGSCHAGQGCIYLLSGGSDRENSYAIGASGTGADIFFISRAELVPQDRGGDDFAVYDARVGASQPALPPACAGTGCQGAPPPPPIFATPSSATFNGVGNFPASSLTTSKPAAKKTVRCKKPRKLRQGRCVKVKAKKSKGKRSNRGVK